MLTLLQSFIAVLEEFGVSHGRAQNAALCAAEGLLSVCFLFVLDSTQYFLTIWYPQSGAVLKELASSEVTALITGIQTYTELAASSKSLIYPLANPAADLGAMEGTEEVNESSHSDLLGASAHLYLLF